jgi:hypothetical protein
MRGRRQLIAGMALAALAPPLPLARAVEPPPELVEWVDQAIARCRTAGGEAHILDGFRTESDLNGDGAADFVADLGRVQCEGAGLALCSPSGCPAAAFLSRPGDDGFDRFDFGDLVGVEVMPGEGALPVLRATYDTGACAAEALEASACTRRWTFTDNAPSTPAFDLPAVTRPLPRPGPAPAAVGDRGWTLRRVPGASPAALGAGPGNVASLGAFCLSGTPFLALRFHAPPVNAQVTARFGFSDGAQEVVALREDSAGGAFVIDLEASTLAARLAGRDSAIALGIDGEDQGTLSLGGSTQALRGALEECYDF